LFLIAEIWDPTKEYERKRKMSVEGQNKELREMEVEEKRMHCDQIPYFCYQKKTEGRSQRSGEQLQAPSLERPFVS
jgi:hypothetical protein